MGMKSFEKFFKKFDKIEAKSLVLSKEVIREREHLQLVLQMMPKKIMEGLQKIDTLQQEETVMRKHESDILANKEFTYKIDMNKQRKIDLKGKGIATSPAMIIVLTLMTATSTCAQRCFTTVTLN